MAKVWQRTRAKLVRSTKDRIVVFLGLTSRALFRFVSARAVQTLLTWVPWGPLRGFARRGWVVVLRLSNHRSLLADWIRWHADKTGRIDLEAELIQTLLAAERIEDAAERLLGVKERVFRDPGLAEFGDLMFELDTLLAVEAGGAPRPVHWSLRGMSALADFYYAKLWETHTMRMADAVAHYAELYLTCVGFRPDRVIHVCRKLLRANGLWESCVDIGDLGLGEVENARFKLAEELDGTTEDSPRLAAELQLQNDHLIGVVVDALVEIGELDRVESYVARLGNTVLERPHDNPALVLSVARYHAARDDRPAAIELLTQCLGRGTRKGMSAAERSVFAEISGELAVLYEEQRDDVSALFYYRRAINLGGVGSYLPGYVWRFISFLMVHDGWDEALHIMRTGYSRIVRAFEPLARVKFSKRIAQGYALAPNGALFLGSWGLGDELIRLRFFADARTDGAPYAFVCDPRLVELFGRSFPGVEFMYASRAVGASSVDYETYLEDRSGVPEGVDRARVDNRILAKARQYPDIGLSEDLMFEFVRSQGRVVKPTDAPMLTPDASELDRARKWLATLPEPLSVGISWRSGMRNVSRGRSYSNISDWEEILTVPGINFVSLQYSDTTEELAEVERKFGVKVHHMPDLDLKQDIEGIAALSSALDLVIAPCTTVRELAAAVGAHTWSLTTTLWWPDHWRIDEDGETDRLFRSMNHITAQKLGGLSEVLAETGRRLKEWGQQGKSAA